jgi:Chaperonin 10 Kd subunit
MAAKQVSKCKYVRAIHDTVIVTDMTFDSRISRGGIIILNDDMKSVGIRPRWGRVYSVGPEQKEIKVGQYILVSHGRWTRGVTINDDEGEKTIRKVDNKDILLISDELVFDETFSDKA